MSEILSVEGQLVGIPVEKYTGVSGIVVDPVNKTIRADETVLWEGSSWASGCTLSESINNFEAVDFYTGTGESPDTTIVRKATGASEYALTLWFQNTQGQWIICAMGRYTVGNSGLSLTAKNRKHLWFSTTNFSLGGQSVDGPLLKKIVGINRKA